MAALAGGIRAALGQALIEGIAALAAAEAFVGLALVGDLEAGRFLVVKRARYHSASGLHNDGVT